MDEKNLNYLVVSNLVVLGVFIVKQMFDYRLARKKRQEEKAERDAEKQVVELETKDKEFIELKIAVVKMTAQLELIMKQLYIVQELEKDVKGLFKLIREKT